MIKSVEGDSISPAAKKLLEDNRQKMLAKQKSEKLSPKSMELYINIDKETPKTPEDDIMPAVEKRVIKLDAKSPEDEDFGL